jgi:hypothetical protein
VAYEVRIDEARRLVVAEIVGPIGAEATLDLVARAREAASESGLNILYDMRRSIPGDMSSGALFWMPRQLPQLQGTEARRKRVALLHLPQYGAMASHWENTFRNAGLSVRAFVDEETAIDWLGRSNTAPAD